MTKKVRIREEVFQMRFEDIYSKFKEKKLNCKEAANILGVSLSSFYRKRQRFKEKDFNGLFDRRIGKSSHRKASIEEVKFLLHLYESKYKSFNVKHFHSHIKRELSYGRSYSWVKKTLMKAGLIQKGVKGGKYRQRRERKPLEGMLLHQDASSHRWIKSLNYNIDLVVTLDDASSKITSAFFVLEEGTLSTFRGLKETIEAFGLFQSFYTDRGSHYFYTPKAGGRVDKGTLTQVGRALRTLGIQHIAAYSPQARGRSERVFKTLQGRLPQELELLNIQSLEEANKYLKEKFIPSYNEEFSKPTQGKAFIPWAGGNLEDILCLQDQRVVRNDNTVSYEAKTLQIPKTPYRYHYFKAKVRIHKYWDQSLALFHHSSLLGRYDRKGNLIKKDFLKLQTKQELQKKVNDNYSPYFKAEQNQIKEV